MYQLHFQYITFIVFYNFHTTYRHFYMLRMLHAIMLIRKSYISMYLHACLVLCIAMLLYVIVLINKSINASLSYLLITMTDNKYLE